MLIYPRTTAERSHPVWPPYRGTGTADQADLAKLGSAQLNLMSLHSTLVWQLPIIKHKIDKHGGRSLKRQRLPDKPHDDDDDAYEGVFRLQPTPFAVSQPDIPRQHQRC